MKKRWLLLLKVVVAALLIYFLASRQNISAMMQKLGSINFFIFFAAVILYFLSNFLGAAQWTIFLRNQHIKVSFFKVVSYYFTGLFFNSLLFTSVGGDVVKLVDVTRGEKKETSRVLATILVDRVLGVTCLILLGTLFLLLFLLFGKKLDTVVLLFYLVFDGFILGLFLFFFSARIRYICFILVRKIGWKKARLWLIHFLRSLSCYSHEKGLFPKAFLVGIANQSIKIAVTFLVGYAIQESALFLSLPLLFVFLPMLGIIKLLPVNFFGFGPHEMAGERLFATVGVAGHLSIPFLLVVQFMVLCTNLLSGVFFFVRRK